MGCASADETALEQTLVHVLDTMRTFGHGVTTRRGQGISVFRGGSGPKPASFRGRPERSPVRFWYRTGSLDQEKNEPPTVSRVLRSEVCRSFAGMDFKRAEQCFRLFFFAVGVYLRCE